MKLKKDGRLVQARITPRITKDKATGNSGIRRITVKQLTVLLYHYWITLDDPLIGTEDAEESPLAFQAALSQEVDIEQSKLEKLLWHLQMAHESNMYWNPAQEDVEEFIKGMLGKKEHFNKLYCLIMEKRGN